MKLDQSIIKKCKDEQLQKVLVRLEKFNDYYSLLDGSIATYTRVFDTIGQMPAQLKEWLKIFDGGFLFTTQMLSTRNKVEGHFSQLLTFEEVNSEDFKEDNAIHPDVVCFAMTNFGNYYCFVAGEESGWVYEWDVEDYALTIKWNSFAEWLNEQIDFADSLIKEGVLDPMED